MQYNSNFYQTVQNLFRSGLFGVLLFIFIPQNIAAQVDSLQLSQSLDGLAQSILKFADYDSDGDLDLIFAGTNSSSVPTVRLYKNNGSGSFTEDHNSTITGFSYPGLSWGDVDGDGDLDFAISGNTSTGYQAKLYLNNGAAVFTEATSDPFYDAYWGNMEFGDLDNDGDLDIFQTGLQANSTRVAEIFWNDGNGSYTKDTNNTFTGVADGETPLADLDNDGDLDILLSGYIDVGGNITQIHLNNGNGNFTQSQSLQGVASNGMDFGDYDNDGDLDLILTGRDYIGNARRAYIYENDGSASFSVDTSNTIAPVSYSNTKWGDYDHDGDLDLILSGFGDGGFRETYIYTNNGTGTMSYTSNAAITGSEEGYVDWADLDGDGFLEVAITGWDGSNRMTKIYQNIRTKNNSAPTAPSNIQYSTNQGVLTFTWDASTDSDGGPLEYNVFLVNSDSAKTFLSALSDTSNGYRRIVNTGNSGLTRSHKVTVNNLEKGSYLFGVQSIDGAGRTSTFETKSGYEIQLISNANTIYSASYNVRKEAGIRWVDIDGDQDLDLIELRDDGYFYCFGCYNPKNYKIFYSINNGDGTLGNPVQLRGTSWASELPSVDVGDLDNDGDVDFVMSGLRKLYDNFTYDENRLWVYLSNGINNYTGSGIFIQSSYVGNYKNISLNDVDNDGDLDIISLAYDIATDTDDSKILINDGIGNFSERSTNINGLEKPEVLWFDFEGDGDNDLFISGYKKGGVPSQVLSSRFFINSGNGVFNESSHLQALIPRGYSDGNAVNHYPLIQFDYDDDGDLDLVYINESNRIQAFQFDGTDSYAIQNELTSIFPDSNYYNLKAVDINNDLKRDLILSKHENDSEIYFNNGNGNFQLSDEQLPGHAFVAVSDYDKDGDLDFATQGKSGSNYYVASYRNDSGTYSGDISAPTNLKTKYLDNNRIKFSWTSPSQNEKFSYHVYVKNKSTGTLFGKSVADTASGFRRAIQMGNAGYESFYIINPKNLPTGNYEWAVQSIGADHRSSDFIKFNTPALPFNNLFDFSTTEFVNLTDTTTKMSRGLISIEPYFLDSTLTMKTSGISSGTLFIDSNGNKMFDQGESVIDSSGISFNYATTDSIRFLQTSPGFDSYKLFINNGNYSDSVQINLAAHSSSHSISGTANEGGWNLITNPFQSSIGTLLENIWTQGAINGDSESGTPNIYTYDPDSAKYIPITTDLDTTKTSAGEGILVYIFPDDDYNDAIAPVNGGWPKTLTNYGDPFSENISIPIKNVDTDGDGFTSGSEGFQLLGNPFGFSMSIDSLVASIRNVDAFANQYIYRWDAVNKKYTLHLNGSIEPYESFFVRTISTGTSGTVNVDYDDAHSSARLKTRKQNLGVQFQLSADSIATGSYAIRLSNNAETNIDPLDGYYLGSYASNFTNLYSTIGDQPLVLNNLPLGLSEVVEIPLYVHSTEVGKHQLEWELNSFPEEWSIELEDPMHGTIINLREESNYSFSISHQQLKQKIAASPELFSFHANRGKTKAISADLILRINPGVSTHGEDDLGIPREVELYQNYPNPFNPSSVIRFGVPEQAPVQLEVFDILGRKVMTLLNGEIKQPGRYNINFDGRSLASGMYIYRLVIGNKVLTKKMTLIK